MSYPPLFFDHPAIYKTSWRAGETIALVYNYAKTHTIIHVYCRRETLGIIFSILPTFPTFCKESLGITFPTFSTFPTFTTFCKESFGYQYFVQNVGKVGTMMPNDSLQNVGKVGKMMPNDSLQNVGQLGNH